MATGYFIFYRGQRCACRDRDQHKKNVRAEWSAASGAAQRFAIFRLLSNKTRGYMPRGQIKLKREDSSPPSAEIMDF